MTEIYKLKPTSENYCLMATIGSVSAGEPQEIEHAVEKIDLNEFVTGGSEDIFMIRANGDSMEAEIKSGDWLIVNRNLQPNHGDKVIARFGNSFTVKIYAPVRNGLSLVASNGKYAPRNITAKDDCEIFGVVTHVLHSLKKNLRCK